ncbi:YwiC-like family protein [Propioniciclava coleopterorum]|uniref:YwiC-like family protein n=1 Tax=Propioniciclava coleopterorum TaxID=2714937 RepID=A0A6G7Y483_9ACTN|nr:YwiC-like family protein [Propioniciclava coleopterorum]QIK71593.1 YwiC-like family protein [Propioniciclava coleopterorum]
MRTGWIPNQHGAWAMLIVPFVFGAVLAARAGVAGWWLLPLFCCWMLGYFAFHDASLWLKAAPRRRPTYVRPLLTYTAASAAAGVLTLVLGGWALAGWALAYLPLLLPALWLASRRKERATVGGALTVAAACLMTLVARFGDPRALLARDAAWECPALVAVLLFAYFFGTVLYVKTNIRERGSRGYLAASIGWHGIATLATVAWAATGHLAWWWPLFFAATTVRSAVVPRLRWSAKKLGFVEVGFTLALGICFLLW